MLVACTGVGSVAECKRTYDACSVCRCAQVKLLNICEWEGNRS